MDIMHEFAAKARNFKFGSPHVSKGVIITLEITPLLTCGLPHECVQASAISITSPVPPVCSTAGWIFDDTRVRPGRTRRLGRKRDGRDRGRPRPSSLYLGNRVLPRRMGGVQ